MTLSVDALLEAARSRAGLQDFGDDWFVEPLTVLVTALHDEAALTPTGADLTRRKLVGLLADRLRLRASQASHPEVRDVEVVVAAEICGLPRTGSTLLHRLLAASPQLTSPAAWEVTYPLPLKDEGPGGRVRQERHRTNVEAYLATSPDFEAIHTVTWDGPEEDVMLLDRSFTTMSFDSFYWIPSYGVWLRSYDQSRGYAELREWLQALQHQEPSRAGRRWALKSPHHLTAVDTVLDAFPECRIVMTHRSPVQAVPSYASMVLAMSSAFSESLDAASIGRYWSERFRESLVERFPTVRERRPERFVDVHFKAMLTQPLEEARRVLSEVGLTPGPADDAAFEAYLERNRQERHGKHSYTAEDFGLTDEQLARDFAPYTEAYL